MSNKHYTQYSKFSGEEPMLVNDPELEVEEENKEKVEEPIEGQIVIPEVEPEPVFIAPVSDPEPSVEPENRKFGKVSNCKKLNIRKLPSRDAEIVSELIEGSEVMIDEKESTALFYKICTEHGIEGYCMKNFIKVVL